MKYWVLHSFIISFACLSLISAAFTQNDPKVLTKEDARSLIESLRKNEVESLTGLNKVFVTSDRVSAELITQGLDIESIVRSVEVTLRNRGIGTVDFANFLKLKGDGWPFIKIKFELTKVPNEDRYNGLVKVALTQRVIMSRLKTKELFGETWHTQKPILGEGREEIGRIVLSIINEEFLRDFNVANSPPKPS